MEIASDRGRGVQDWERRIPILFNVELVKKMVKRGMVLMKSIITLKILLALVLLQSGE